MCQTNENTSVNLKLVMLFDWRKHAYCICSHNLSPEDASAEVNELRRATAFPPSRSINARGICKETPKSANPAEPMFSSASIHRLLLNGEDANSAANRRLKTTNGITTDSKSIHNRQLQNTGGTSCQRTATATRITSF